MKKISTSVPVAMRPCTLAPHTLVGVDGGDDTLVRGTWLDGSEKSEGLVPIEMFSTRKPDGTYSDSYRTLDVPDVRGSAEGRGKSPGE